MKHAAIVAALAAFAVSTTADAAWYWPFGGKQDKPPRISELTEHASELMDEATDLAADGKVDQAVEKYREARAELERIEYENPARAATDEFATVRNKKAYIDVAIDSLLLKQAKSNVKAVAVSDTTQLERRYKHAEALRKKPGDRKLLLSAAADDIEDKHYSAAKEKLSQLLQKDGKDASALMLYAAAEAGSGRTTEAEGLLRQAVEAAPGSHYPKYNLARLLIDSKSGAKRAKDEARRLYVEGREKCGGPRDEAIEAALLADGTGDKGAGAKGGK